MRHNSKGPGGSLAQQLNLAWDYQTPKNTDLTDLQISVLEVLYNRTPGYAVTIQKISHALGFFDAEGFVGLDAGGRIKHFSELREALEGLKNKGYIESSSEVDAVEYYRLSLTRRTFIEELLAASRAAVTGAPEQARQPG